MRMLLTMSLLLLLLMLSRMWLLSSGQVQRTKLSGWCSPAPHLSSCLQHSLLMAPPDLHHPPPHHSCPSSAEAAPLVHHHHHHYHHHHHHAHLSVVYLHSWCRCALCYCGNVGVQCCCCCCWVRDEWGCDQWPAELSVSWSGWAVSVVSWVSTQHQLTPHASDQYPGLTDTAQVSLSSAGHSLITCDLRSVKLIITWQDLGWFAIINI